MRLSDEDEDVLEMVQDMRANYGALDIGLPYALLSSSQRDIEGTIGGLRQFGYALQITHDVMGRVVRVTLVDQ